MYINVNLEQKMIGLTPAQQSEVKRAVWNECSKVTDMILDGSRQSDRQLKELAERLCSVADEKIAAIKRHEQIAQLESVWLKESLEASHGND